jgi:hypothetical protein
MEFQRESQRAVRNTGLAESAVWAVFAACSVLSIVLSLCQITPASVQSNSPKGSSVVCERPDIQPVVYPIQTT